MHRKITWFTQYIESTERTLGWVSAYNPQKKQLVHTIQIKAIGSHNVQKKNLVQSVYRIHRKISWFIQYTGKHFVHTIYGKCTWFTQCTEKELGSLNAQNKQTLSQTSEQTLFQQFILFWNMQFPLNNSKFSFLSSVVRKYFVCNLFSQEMGYFLRDIPNTPFQAQSCGGKHGKALSVIRSSQRTCDFPSDTPYASFEAQFCLQKLSK